MLAVLRMLAIGVYFLSINFVLLCVCIARPFHRNNVSIAGDIYSSMSKIMGVKVVIENADIIDPDKNYVCIANHQNTFDLMTTAKGAFDGVTTIGKTQIKYIPVFGLIYWLTGNIMIDRKNSGRAQDTLKETAKQINDNNRSVWFFPEGTRSYGRGLLPFKTGAFRIAEATQKPIMMICTSNTHGKIKWNRWDNGVVKVRYYEPEQIDDSKDIKAWTRYFYNQMHERLTELNRDVTETNKHIKSY